MKTKIVVSMITACLIAHSSNVSAEKSLTDDFDIPPRYKSNYDRLFDRFDSWFSYKYKNESEAITDLKEALKYMKQCAWVSCEYTDSFSVAVFRGEKEAPKSCRRAFSKRTDVYTSLKKTSGNIVTNKVNSYVYVIEKYNDDICD